MKATGMVRRVDELGRVVIPKEIRRTLNVDSNDAIEIFTDDDGNIILRKYQPNCIICTRHYELIDLHGKKVCVNCIDELVAKEAELNTKESAV